MAELESYIKIKSGSEKNFGYTFVIIFFIISIYLYLHNSQYSIFFALISITLLIITKVNASMLKKPNYIWFKFGILLGKTISPIVMILIFYSIFTLTGLILRIIKKDILKINNNYESNDSFWVDRTEDIESMKKQY